MIGLFVIAGIGFLIAGKIVWFLACVTMAALMYEQTVE